MGFLDKAKKSAQGIIEDKLEQLENEKEAKAEERELIAQKEKEFQDRQQENKRLFRATKVMGDIEIDENNKLLKIHNAQSNIKKASGKLVKSGKAILAFSTMGASLAIEHAMKPGDVIFSFDEINDYDLMENDIAVASGGLGRAVAGGVLLGGVGAVVGGVTGKKKTKKSVENLALQITTNDFYFPSIIITYIDKEVKTKSSKYLDAMSTAKQTMACLDIIFQQIENMPKEEPIINESTSNPYDEIKKAKELLDMGIISQEEFDEKKKQLLGL